MSAAVMSVIATHATIELKVKLIFVVADREKNICFDFAKRNYLIEKFPIFLLILAGFKLFLVEFMHDTRRAILSREPT